MLTDAGAVDYPTLENIRKDPLYKPVLAALDFFLEKELLPTFSQFYRVLKKFSFNSPLNFLMLKDDFRKFY